MCHSIMCSSIQIWWWCWWCVRYSISSIDVFPLWYWCRDSILLNDTDHIMDISGSVLYWEWCPARWSGTVTDKSTMSASVIWSNPWSAFSSPRMSKLSSVRSPWTTSIDPPKNQRNTPWTPHDSAAIRFRVESPVNCVFRHLVHRVGDGQSSVSSFRSHSIWISPNLQWPVIVGVHDS